MLKDFLLGAVGGFADSASRGIQEEQERKRREAQEQERMRLAALDDYERTGRWDEKYLGKASGPETTEFKVPGTGGFMDAKFSVTSDPWKRMASGVMQDTRRTPEYAEAQAKKRANWERSVAMNQAGLMLPKDEIAAMNIDPSLSPAETRARVQDALDRQRVMRENAAQEAKEKAEAEKTRAEELAKRVAIINRSGLLGIAKRRGFGNTAEEIANDDDVYKSLINEAFSDARGGGGSGGDKAEERVKLLDGLGNRAYDTANGDINRAIMVLRDTLIRSKVDYDPVEITRVINMIHNQRLAGLGRSSTQNIDNPGALPGKVVGSYGAGSIRGGSGGGYPTDEWRQRVDSVIPGGAGGGTGSTRNAGGAGGTSGYATDNWRQGVNDILTDAEKANTRNTEEPN